MSESQNIEWKKSWHDDYLKWVCGFANAFGGTIFIGKDDNGVITHLADYRNLLELIPNKIREHLGIIAEVNLHQENGAYFLEIVVPPYTVPVSLRGRYYYRTGSTKLELTGNALNEFLLKKSGKTWDNVPEAVATFNDIDTESVKTFIKDAQKSGRMPDVSDLSIQEFFEKLRLSDEGEIKRAAIILFGKDPNRFYPNVMVKIGRFGSGDADLKFQETEEGNLIQLLKNVLNQLNYKFFTNPIDFEGMQRVEKGEYPVAAIREMLLNALVHRTYMGSMIQLRVYDNKLTLWNEGNLPEGMELESLKRHHISRPRNPIIADICFKAGYIDSWGRGTLKIISSCKEAGLPEPTITTLDGGILVTLFKDKFSTEQLKSLGLTERQIAAVEFVKKNKKITNKEFQLLSEISDATASRDLKTLTKLGIFKISGSKGSGTFYEFD
jgi:ATP-dependent DNA helicase RecG